MPRLKPDTVIPTAEEDQKINAGVARDPDNPEWSSDDFARARRFRGKQKSPTKIPVSIRLDPVIIESYKASGTGWQSRLNDDLLSLVKRRQRRRAKS